MLIVAALVSAVCVGIMMRWCGYHIWRVTLVWLLVEAAMLLFTVVCTKLFIHHVMRQQSENSDMPLVLLRQATPGFLLMTGGMVVVKVATLWALGHACWLRQRQDVHPLNIWTACVVIAVNGVVDCMLDGVAAVYHYLWHALMSTVHG